MNKDIINAIAIGLCGGAITSLILAILAWGLLRLIDIIHNRRF